jgi:hypothetical protein
MAGARAHAIEVLSKVMEFVYVSRRP